MRDYSFNHHAACKRKSENGVEHRSHLDKGILMLSKILQAWDRLRYLYRINPKVMIWRIVHKIIAPIYWHEVGYVTFNCLMNHKYTDNKGTECIILKTPESLQDWKDRIPPLVPFQKLEGHLADDPESFVILAMRPDSSGSGKKVIGYRMCQPNVFVFPGIKEKLPLNSLFTIHTEVFPEYQRQKVNQVMTTTTHEFCRQKGLTKILGVILAHNQPSIETLKQVKGARIIARFESLSLFFGLYRFSTPLDEIKKAIENNEKEKGPGDTI